MRRGLRDPVGGQWNAGDVKPEDAITRLRNLRDEAATLPLSTSSTEFNSWMPRARSVLTRALGEKHHITERFVNTRWTPSMFTMGDTSAFTATFRATIPEAQGILDAAIAEIELLADEVPVADESGIDAELWEHIAPEIQSEAWGKVASQAAIFTEDRIRKWAGRPVGEVGKDLQLPCSASRAITRWGSPTVRSRGGSCSPKALPRLCGTWTPTAFRSALITSAMRLAWSGPAPFSLPRCVTSTGTAFTTPPRRLRMRSPESKIVFDDRQITGRARMLE